MRPVLHLMLAALLTGHVSAAGVDYLRDVKPLLAQHCWKCHGPLDQRGELRLDTAAHARTGGGRGPAVQPGNPDDSLLIQAVLGTAHELRQMPLRNPPLTGEQVGILREWITAGTPAPEDEAPADPLAAARNHWSFIPPRRPPVPPVTDHASRITNPIDAFIVSRLVKESITPSPEADRHTLIRRVSLDLTGLPPTPVEVAAFVNDPQPGAYERLVERLLDSPHHGERWGRWWLDVARYADSNGYSIDAPRSIWLYRDWVIHAFNRDLPFDDFVIQQIAGDILASRITDHGSRNDDETAPPEARNPKLETPETQLRIATGFHRNTQINQEGGIDPEQFRIESVVDRLATTGTAFLGLTIACAQCHDHKFDPISHEEYFRLFAIFNNQDEPTLEILNPKVDHAALDAEQAALAAELTAQLHAAAERIAREEMDVSPEAVKRFHRLTQEALKQPAAERTFKQRRLVYLALGGNDQEFRAKEARLSELESGRGRTISTLVLSERAEPRESYIHLKGDFTRKGKVVTPGTPAVLHKFSTPDAQLPTRLDFAHWLASPENPLLARVTVNRVWQQYFGKGLVETENDFGTQGLPPSHPELLDWLAVEFMDSGWSLKHLHRLIVTSATYRQSSHARPDLAVKDPNNKLLARQNRLRLDAELVRDVALSVSGLLTQEIGGPSVFPPQPDGVMSLGQVKREWRAAKNEDRYRRGMYTFFYRATPHPALTVFDAPDAFSACSRRPRSNTPLQALTLLNDEGFFEFAGHFAERIARAPAADDTERLQRAFEICLGRPPQPDEVNALTKLLAAERQHGGGDGVEPWLNVARVLLNLDETITRE
jgi:hypothetical protein